MQWGSFRVLLRISFFLDGEEALEYPFRLPFSRILEINPNVHTTWTTQRRVEPFNMVCGGKEESREDGLAWRKKSTPLLCTHRPSAAATPSKLLRRPLRVSVEASSSFVSFSFLVVAAAFPGAPVELSSREIPRVKAASRSSSSKMHLLQMSLFLAA